MTDPVGSFRWVSDRLVHQGYVWKVVVAEFDDPAGERFTRDIVRSPGAVGVVPLVFDAEGNASVVLVEQYRPPYDRPLLEIPAGMRDIEGEAPEEVARRELIEEAGLAPGRLDRLTAIGPSPGMTDSITTIYLATDCSSVHHDRQGPEEQYMELVHLPLRDAVERVISGEIIDAKTVVGLLLTERRLATGDG
jgi:8-oxo-dGTP pyrophosphatase MutT (NUDIX family)